MSTPLVELLFTLAAQVRQRRSVAATPLGERMVFDVTGGDFDGPRLRGTVDSGSDWVVHTSAGSRLDVRLVLETDDGTTLLFEYGGRASLRNGTPRIEVAGCFEAPQGPYDWLNSVQAFGLGTPVDGGVSYQFFCFS